MYEICTEYIRIASINPRTFKHKWFVILIYYTSLISTDQCTSISRTHLTKDLLRQYEKHISTAICAWSNVKGEKESLNSSKMKY